MPTDEEIRHAYFLWLTNLVGIHGRGKRELCTLLHEKEFIWFVPNDDNRAQDGMKLREDFADEVLDKDCPCLDGPCTVLEMLVALSKRMIFEVGGRPSEWFWTMVRNLRLEPYSEGERDHEQNRTRNEEILDIFIQRRYDRYGRGGLFPLELTRRDQRYVEIWYQMMAWYNENYS